MPRSAAAIAAVALGLGLAQAAPASALHAPVTVLEGGLDAPFGLDRSGSYVYVAQSGTGTVVRVNATTGAATTVVRGLKAPAAVARVGSELAVITSGPEALDVASTRGTAMLYRAFPGGRPRPFANLLAYERLHNPDGQRQFDPRTGKPLDALSNPFGLLKGRGSDFALVADGGANAVLAVSHSGKVRTFFVPPMVRTGACKGRPNNDPQHLGCDSVPTGLAYGPFNTLYVSALTGEAPGQGRVYVLDATTGKLRRVISGLTAPTGVASHPRAPSTSPRCSTTRRRETARRRRASTRRKWVGSCASGCTAPALMRR